VCGISFFIAKKIIRIIFFKKKMSFFYETAKFLPSGSGKPQKQAETIDDALKTGKLTSRQSAIIDSNIEKKEKTLRAALTSNIEKYEKIVSQLQARGQNIAATVKRSGRPLTPLQKKELLNISDQRKLALARIDGYQRQIYNIDCQQGMRGDIKIARIQSEVTVAQRQYMDMASLTVGEPRVEDMASISVNTKLVRQSANTLATFNSDQTQEYIDSTLDEQRQRDSAGSDVDVDSLLDEFSFDDVPVRLTSNNNNNNNLSNNNNNYNSGVSVGGNYQGVDSTDAEDKLLEAFDRL